ncbi:MAG: malic enzyme-like NAD(P)-binding protein [Candidatus Peribacteraceae bacterium]
MAGDMREEALQYHRAEPRGKTGIQVTKPCATQHDLSLAYTPGVAAPVKEIARDPSTAYEYTNKGNLVAIVSNGTSVLGLGNQGALASKPVMEGKAVLFKRFAGIDVYDIEIDSEDPQEIIRVVERIAPTFGAICLEDIRSPECFEVERILRERLPIPVFHDDQHGTAIVVAAALTNALELTGRQFKSARIVLSGAGAAAVATRRLLIRMGVQESNVMTCDSRGVIYEGRTENMKQHKYELAVKTEHRTIADALVGADVFIGVSRGRTISGEMVQNMAESPVIFALANPEPEIAYDEAQRARGTPIIATGRSDYPNQVNNVLAFPGVFRGALDMRSREITEPMKAAAARALAALARQPVPQEVLDAYQIPSLSFGHEYILPKPLDPRVVEVVAQAVQDAASGE